MARHHNTTNDYGTPAVKSNKMHRPAITVNHALHWISSLIVLGISAYFIHKFHHNAHLIYWVTLAAIDAFLYTPAMLLPASKSYKGYLAPLAWILSYLWLTAFIFSAQDYNYGSSAHSPAGVNKPHLKHTLEAFAFIAFITNLIGQFLEARLWDLQRFKGHHGAGKHDAGIANTQPTTTTAV